MLGTMLLGPEPLAAGVNTLTASAFFKTGHQLIFEHLRRLHVNDGAADLLTLEHALRCAGELDEVGGRAAIAALLEAAGLNALLPSYIAIVLEEATKRELIKLAADMGAAAYSGGFAARDLIDTGARRLQALAETAQASGPAWAPPTTSNRWPRSSPRTIRRRRGSFPSCCPAAC